MVKNESFCFYLSGLSEGLQILRLRGIPFSG